MGRDQQVYHRPDYARDMARQLLRPGPLEVNVRSGVFLSGIRRIGKTTFLREDLVPELEREGAVVIYVDLWADPSKNPMNLVLEAVRATLAALADASSSLLGRLSRLKGLNLGAAGFSFGFQIDAVGEAGVGGATLAQAFTAIVDAARTDVVLIVDEVQQAMGADGGSTLMHALKAARDAVNTRPGTPGYLLFLGTGSHRSLITEMATRRSQPFMGAQASIYAPLDEAFVAWKLAAIRALPGAAIPSSEVAADGFRLLGCRPEELTKALVQLQDVVRQRGLSADQAFPVICDTLAQAMADVEMRAVEDFGVLGQAVFDLIARNDADAVSGLFGRAALEEYAARTGREVEPSHVQNVIDKLVESNLIARAGQGAYRVVDPFVRQYWRGRAALLRGR
ncbi:ATP-binding protein [Burkholderia sp. 22PA0099]|uniref:ATP-binding protein n=1 Tax=Burkholderia sp. 22PA0099 TaxID=3237372 RepID=UPI0039C21221